MRSIWRLMAVAVVTLSLAGCSTSGLYQARDGNSGYAETRLDASRWRVEFVGDDFTSRERVDSYLLYRVAELTAESGHRWFAMATPAFSEDVEIIVEAERPQAYRDLHWRPHWRRRSRFFWSDLDPVGPMPHERHDAPEISERVHYSASAEIVVGDGPAPAGAFDARETIARLAPAIVRPRS